MELVKFSDVTVTNYGKFLNLLMPSVSSDPIFTGSMKPYDSNKQTALDMAFARNRTSITVENVRNFLHRELLYRRFHID